MADDDKGKGGDKELKLPKEFLDTINALAQGQKALGESIGELKTSLADLEKKSSSKGGDDDDDDKSGGKVFDDLETLSRKDFMGVILDQLGKKIEDAIKPISTDLHDHKDNLEKKDTQALLAQARKDHKDFDDFKEEILAEAKANPLLGPEDAYQLARLKNPEKAKEMDTKYMSNEEKEKIKSEEEKKKLEGEEDIAVKFGGLTPTSGKTVDSKVQNADDAGETAWQRVFGGQKEV